jgi:PKD repeat protein
MKKIIVIVVGILLFSGFAVGNISSFKNIQSTDNIKNMYSINEREALILYCTAHPQIKEFINREVQSPLKDYPIDIIRSSLIDYPIGTTIWQYFITGGSDNSVKPIAPIEDINADGIGDVIVSSEDYYVRCFSGGAIGTGSVLWSHFIYSGSLMYQNELAIRSDINGDGYDDVVVGTPWGSDSIITLSGLNGNVLWTHDTHEYGGGGWVYQVDCKYDYNNDGVIDVLASTGDDGSGTGPNRVYCLNGLTGAPIWEFYLGGAGFSVFGIEDCTGDGIPDVVAGCTDAAQMYGYVKGINGATGGQIWSFTTPSSSVWALEQTDDLNGDGVKDVIIGTFSGQINGLSATNGAQIYSTSIGSAIIQRFAKLIDVNSDGHPDFVPEHSSVHITQAIDGQTGSILWTHAVADQPWRVARTADISGDAIDDVFLGTMYNSNYVYFLNGVDGSELVAPIYYGASYDGAVDGLNAIPDVVNDGSMEMVVGGRDGKLTCYSGGLNASSSPSALIANFSAAPTTGAAPLTVQFTDLSTAVNTTITSWKWDFDNDGTIDSTEEDPSWIYNDNGTYAVSLTISDGHISDTETKEHYITVLSSGIILVEIGNITGSILKVNAEILNNGTINVTSLNWSITVDGRFVLLGKTKSGTNLSIPVGGTEVISDKPVFGFGNIIITVKVDVPGGDSLTKTVRGFLFLFVVLGIK